jgi:hypothetical protein
LDFRNADKILATALRFALQSAAELSWKKWSQGSSFSNLVIAH